MLKARADILLVGQTPPPYHGQSVVTGMLFDDLWEGLKVERLRMAYSDRIEVVGQVSAGKVFHLIGLIFRTWKIALIKRPKLFYYLPASSNRAAVIRDIIYLAAVRWCFSRTVFHYHAGGLPEYVAGAGLLGKFAKLVYRNADISIEITETELSPAEAFGAKKQVFIANGLDVERKSSVEDCLFRILFVGALSEGKGVMEALKAIQIAKLATSKPFKFQLAGAWSSESFEEECKIYIENNDLADTVEFLGIVKAGDKWQTYENADLFLFPSHYHAENFPLVLIEAMAFGLPIISTKWRGIPQLVEGSNAAILCEVRAYQAMADAVVQFVDTPDTLMEYSDNARQHYLRNYTRSKFVKAVRTQFEGLLGL